MVDKIILAVEIIYGDQTQLQVTISMGEATITTSTMVVTIFSSETPKVVVHQIGDLPQTHGTISKSFLFFSVYFSNNNNNNQWGNNNNNNFNRTSSWGNNNNNNSWGNNSNSGGLKQTTLSFAGGQNN